MFQSKTEVVFQSLRQGQGSFLQFGEWLESTWILNKNEIHTVNGDV